MPGDPTEDLDDRLAQFRRVRDQNITNIVAQTDFDDEADFWDSVRAGDDVTLEMDMSDLMVILSELEAAAQAPDNPIGHAHVLDLYVRLNEQHRDAIEQFVQERNAELDDMADDPRGYQ